MTLSNKFTLSLASLAVLGLLAACSNHTAQTPASSASSQQVASSASSASSSKDSQTASQAENLDGTYKGTDENDQITLTLSGTTGTWEEVEKESKPVTIHADNHTLTVGDDLKYYKLEGNQLTIEDDDRDPSDTIVLTK